MDIIQLDVLGKNVYRAKKMSFGNGILKSKDMLAQPDSFHLAVKAADGCYHKVYSEISQVIEKDRELLAKSKSDGIIKAVMSEDENIHGRRFVIFHPKNSENAFLLGDIATALKKLSHK
ncbi:MAG: hypothetical protein QXH80_01540 [Candidatus Nanoarchaeia archaeon]